MFDQAQENYQTDPQFRQLVDCIRALLHKRDFTPSEVRSAAMLACELHEGEKPRVMVLTTQEWDKFCNYMDHRNQEHQAHGG